MSRFERPSFVYFDLGKVLLNFDHNIAAENLGELAGVPAAKVRELVFESPLQNEYETGTVSSKQFCDQFREAVGTSVTDAQLMHAASDIFHLNAAIVPIVAHLAATGMPMGILSNTCEAHWQFVKAGRFRLLDQFFPISALSYELKSMKPDGVIYKEAAALAGVKPEQIFFLDDRPENVDGAIAADFDAVLFTTVSQLAKDLAERGVHINY